jgi:hypothetical protein
VCFMKPTACTAKASLSSMMSRSSNFMPYFQNLFRGGNRSPSHDGRSTPTKAAPQTSSWFDAELFAFFTGHQKRHQAPSFNPEAFAAVT